MDQSVYDAIMKTAGRAGMDPAYWTAIASIESSLNASSNYDKGTQYKGLYQIGSRGQGSEWSRHGGGGDIYNPMDNASAAAELAAENNAAFQKHFGRAPSPIETYMMHQQGLGFYTNGTMTNVAGNLPPEARTPENMTHEGFERYWANQLERRAQKFGGGGDLANWTPMQIAAAGGGSTPIPSGPQASAGGAAPSTSGIPSADTGDGGDMGGGDDLAGKLAAIPASLAKMSGDQQQMAPLQWMQIQPMVTPAMMRARALAQAMINNPVGGSTQT